MAKPEPIDFFFPQTWPLKWRRAFLFTLPVSGPIWLACIAIFSAAFMTIAILLTPFVILKEALWDKRPQDLTD